MQLENPKSEIRNPKFQGGWVGIQNSKLNTQNSVQVILLQHIQQHRLTIFRPDRIVLFDLRLEAGDDSGIDSLQHLLRPRDAALATEVLGGAG